MRKRPRADPRTSRFVEEELKFIEVIESKDGKKEAKHGTPKKTR
jgi:hypothetical protein